MKSRQPKIYLLLLVLLLVLSGSLVSVNAQEDGDEDTRGMVRASELSGTQAENIAQRFNGAVDREPVAVDVSEVLRQATRRPDGQVQVIVELATRGAVAQAPSAPQGAVASVQASQDAFIGSLSGVTVVNRISYVANFVTIRATPDQVRQIAERPDVIAVYPDVLVERDHTTSVPTIGADNVWSLLGAYTGDGILIGIIDSGIDYTHVGFGGTGNYAADGGGARTVLPGNALFPAANPTNPGDPKVIGGYDYVGDAYTGSNAVAPDPNPIDCTIDEGGGHGSHVAGTTAGYGVTAVGTTYTGLYNNTIFGSYPDATASFLVGPGVAPMAALAAFKVFGCEGSTDSSNIIAAINDAVAGTYTGGRQVDVINMSLGSSYGSSLAGTPYDVAVTNASLAGTVVVISAGNSGDTFFVSGSPGSSNAAIAVASTLDPSSVNRAVRRDNGAGSPALYAAQNAAFGPYLHAPLTGIGEQPIDANHEGCDPADFTGFTSGHIAVVQRGTCAFVDKANNAFAAGASALIVYNNQAGGLVSMASSPALDPAYNIPSYFISDVDGANLLTDLSSITLDNSFSVTSNGLAGDTLSSFSSRGVNRNPQAVKPDVSAPGDTITSVASGSGNSFYNISGTSMSSPHVAGMAALLRDAFPTATVAEIKARLINTATTIVTNGVDRYGPQRAGSGRASVDDAVAAQSYVYDSANPAGVSVSFGFPEVITGDTYVANRTVAVRNTSGSSITYAISVDTITDLPGVTVTVPASVNVPANSTATFTLTLTADPNLAGIFAINDPTLSATQNSQARHYLVEEAGNVELTGAGETLLLPFYAAPRPASDMQAAYQGVLVTDTANSFNMPLSGIDVYTGGSSDDIFSVVSAFQLMEELPSDPSVTPDQDLRYIGIASETSALNPANGLLGYVFIGLATYGEWATPAAVEFDVYFDFNQDSIADTVMFNYRNSGSTVDVFDPWFFDASGCLGTPGNWTYGDYVNWFPADLLNTYVYNTNMMMLPIDVGFWDQTCGHGLDTTFDFWVEAYSYDSDFVKVSNVYTYDPMNPALSFNDDGSTTGPGSYSDWDGYGFPVDYNFANTDPTDGELEILLLHHHNAASAAVGRAEVVAVINENGIPVVKAVNTANGSNVTNGTVYVEAISDLDIVFNVPLAEGTGPDGADNADNYRLLKEGATTGFQTSVCTSPVDAGDEMVNFSVAYNPATLTSTLTVVGPSPWPPLDNGNYRIIACGSTSLTNRFGIPLDGNADGTPGDDYVIDFSVQLPAGGVLQPEDLGVTQLPATGEEQTSHDYIFILLAIGGGLTLLGGAWMVMQKSHR